MAQELQRRSRDRRLERRADKLLDDGCVPNLQLGEWLTVDGRRTLTMLRVLGGE